jgi:hypothetical protein
MGKTFDQKTVDSVEATNRFLLSRPQCTIIATLLDDLKRCKEIQHEANSQPVPKKSLANDAGNKFIKICGILVCLAKHSSKTSFVRLNPQTQLHPLINELRLVLDSY